MWTCVYKNGTYILHHSISRVHFHFLTHKPRILHNVAALVSSARGYSLNLHAGWLVLGSPLFRFPEGRVAGVEVQVSQLVTGVSGNSALVPGHGARWLHSQMISFLACCDWVSSQTAEAAARPILRRAAALLPSQPTLTLSTCREWANNLLCGQTHTTSLSAPVLECRPWGCFWDCTRICFLTFFKIHSNYASK